MTMPWEREAPTEGFETTGRPSFWMIVIGFWLVLIVIAGTLALALAIWNLIGAF